MQDTPETAAARIEVERSRSRVMATAHELQERLSPKTLAKGAWQGAKEKGADLAGRLVDGLGEKRKGRKTRKSKQDATETSQ